MFSKQAKLDEPWNHENSFYWTSDPQRLSKVFAQYEIYKKIIYLPGDIVELGVFKLCSLIRLATCRRFLENDHSRKIYGFDMFGPFPVPNQSSNLDKDFTRAHDAIGDILSLEEAQQVLLNKNFENIQLVKGDIFETIPSILSKKKESLRISLLHLDLDLKSPTLFALEQLWDLVVPGGVVMIDDYACVGSASVAVDNFFREKSLLNLMQKLPYNPNPTYIVKP